MSKEYKLFVLVGLPGSGKSTWCNGALAMHDKNNYVVLSTDAYIEDRAKEKGISYNDAWKDNIKPASRHLQETLKKAIEDKKNIIWDQTNLSIKKRKEIIASVPEYYEKIAVVFEVDSLETIFKRVSERHVNGQKFISKDVVINMSKTYETPTQDEGFDLIVNV